MSPYCTCGEIESVAHYLLTCVRYQNQRETLKNSLLEANITNPLTIKLLLGGEELPVEKQKIITNIMEIFLYGTDKINSL